MAGSVTPWVTTTHPIIDGEQVRQRVANRLPTELQQRTDHLKQRLDAAAVGEALHLRNVAMASTVLAGHAVYWDAVAAEYRSAKASVEFDPTVGAYTIAASSYVVGMCSTKHNDTLGDIALVGTIRDFDFTNGIGTTGATTAEAGAYYLSSSIAGRYTKVKPPVGIYVMYLRGDGVAHINPTPREVLENHIHYVFDLYAQPAGTVTCGTSGLIYTFTDLDETIPGWLPTDVVSLTGTTSVSSPTVLMASTTGVITGHTVTGAGIPADTTVLSIVANVSITMSANATAAATVPLTFQAGALTTAPANTKFGYNMAEHEEFDRAWPPVPVEHAYLEIDGVGVDPDKYVFTESGLWWYDNCFARGPWPIQQGCTPAAAPPTPGPGACTPAASMEEMGFVRRNPETMRMRLYFSKMIFKTNASVVTSLIPAEDSPITIEGCIAGSPNDRGDLKLGLNLGATFTVDHDGYQALKDVSEASVFSKGYVVTGIKAGSNISIAGTALKSVIDPAVSGNNVYRGELTISALDAGSQQREGSIELVALKGVREESILDSGNSNRGIFYLGMPQRSSFVGRVGLPSVGLPTNPQMRLYFWVLSRLGSSALPTMYCATKILTRPTLSTPSTVFPVALTTTFTDIANIVPPSTPVALNSYIALQSAAFSVVAGQDIFFWLARNQAADDAHAADVGILKLGFVVTAS